MKNCTGVIKVVLAILFLAACRHLEAADQREPNVPVKEAAPQAAAAWQRRLPHFFVDVLPLEGVMQYLRERFPEINFLIKTQGDLNTEAGTTEIPVTVRLNSVTLAEILKAIELGASKPIQITGAPDERLVVFERQRNPLPQSPANRIVTRVFNLSEYLAGRSDDDRLKALEQLYDVIEITGKLIKETGGQARQFAPKLYVHHGTRLLIVIGREDELIVVEEVVSGLQGQSHATGAGGHKAIANPADSKVTNP